jgi:hypothetical protein
MILSIIFLFFQKSPLIGRDQFGEKGFNSICNDVGDNIVGYVTNENWPEKSKGGGISLFGNEGDEGGICASSYSCGFLDILDHANQILFNYIPTYEI